MSETARATKFERFTVAQISESTHGPLVEVSLYARRGDPSPYMQFAVDPHTAIEMGEYLRDVGAKLGAAVH